MIKKIFRILSKIKTNRNYVLIMDSLWEPNANIQDNYTFFKYLKKNPKSKLLPYYVVHENSPHYAILKKKYKGSIIKYSQRGNLFMYLKLFLILIKLKYVIDSFQSIVIFKHDLSKIIKKSKNITLIFTQHGVNFFKPDYINENIYGTNIYDKVMISNEFEKKLFIDRCKYNDDDIIKNGLFRWDNILNAPQKQTEKIVFIFFTTRRYLSKITNIEESMYVLSIKELIKNICKKNALNSNMLKFKIGFHHSIAHIFKDIYFQDNVEIISEVNIKEAKEEASLLLTDYSSMCFEFFIQNKPVIFYQLNDCEDCKKVCPELDIINPYKDKEDKLFNICNSPQDVIDTINKYIDSDFKLTKIQQQKEDSFFFYKNHFCDRFYNYLIKGKNND